MNPPLIVKPGTDSGELLLLARIAGSHTRHDIAVFLVDAKGERYVLHLENEKAYRDFVDGLAQVAELSFGPQNASGR